MAYDQCGFHADALLAALDDLDLSGFVGFAYGSGFEAQPQLLSRIAEKLPLIGNTPLTVASVKTPAIFFTALQQLQIPYPAVCHTLPESSAESYLVKTAGGSGGMHISHASQLMLLANHQYFQQRIDGYPVSLLFLGDRQNITVIGFNEQWLSPTHEFPYRYGGAAGNAALAPSVQAELIDAAQKMTKTFSLVGLNSLDGVVDTESGQVFILEINPRLSATVDLYRCTVPKLFDRHVQACLNRHDLSQSDIAELGLQSRTKSQAHAIVYATEEIDLSATIAWPDWVTDTPDPHQHVQTISAGEPVCTVLANADNAQVAKKLAQSRVEIVQNLLQSLNHKNVEQ